MTTEARLARRIEWSLRRVSHSNGYGDTARQIVEDLRVLFPGEVEAAERIATLTAEVDRIRFQRDTATMQLTAHIMRRNRERNQ